MGYRICRSVSIEQQPAWRHSYELKLKSIDVRYGFQHSIRVTQAQSCYDLTKQSAHGQQTESHYCKSGIACCWLAWGVAAVDEKSLLVCLQL